MSYDTQEKCLSCYVSAVMSRQFMVRYKQTGGHSGWFQSTSSDDKTMPRQLESTVSLLFSDRDLAFVFPLPSVNMHFCVHVSYTVPITRACITPFHRCVWSIWPNYWWPNQWQHGHCP